MPRDSSGNYVLPSGNPVIDGTIIEAPWANSTLQDIAVQLNNVLTRDGLLGTTQQFGLIDGTLALPGLFFSADPSVGARRPTTGKFAICSGGADVATFAPDAITLLQPVIASGQATVGMVKLANAATGSTAADGTDLLLDAAGNASLLQRESLALSFGTSATERMRLMAGGPVVVAATSNAGIGAGNDQFAVAGNVGMQGSQLNANPGAAFEVVNRSGLGITLYPASDLPAVRVTQSGLVGLGVVPIFQLDVRGGTPTVARFASTDLGSSLVNFSDGSGSVRGYVGSGASVASGMSSVDFGMAALTGDVVIGTPAEKLRVSVTGNLGVCAPSPQARLHVEANGGYPWFLFRANTSELSRGAFMRPGSALAAGYLGTDGGGIMGGGSGTVFGIRSESDLVLMAGAAERMRIYADGIVTQTGPHQYNQTDTVYRGIFAASGIADAFALDGKTMHNYGLAWMVLSDQPAGPSAVLSGYGGVLICTGGGIQGLRVLSNGSVYTPVQPGTLENTTRVATTAWVQGAMFGGVGQAYASGGHALNTDYTNTANRLKYVSVSVTAPAAQSVTSLVNGAVVQYASNVTGGAMVNTVSAMVPAGSVYRVNCAGGTINTWMEL